MGSELRCVISCRLPLMVLATLLPGKFASLALQLELNCWKRGLMGVMPVSPFAFGDAFGDAFLSAKGTKTGALNHRARISDSLFSWFTWLTLPRILVVLP
jgi:hypothetical protein